MDIVQIHRVKSRSVTGKGRVLEITSVILGIRTTDREDTTLTIRVHTIAELVANFAVVHQILKGGGHVPLRLARESHHTINHLELHKIARLVGDGTQSRGTRQTTQIKFVDIGQTGNGTSLIGIRHHTSLIGIRVRAVVTRAGEATVIEAGARNTLARRRLARVISNLARATITRITRNNQGARTVTRGGNLVNFQSREL